MSLRSPNLERTPGPEETQSSERTQSSSVEGLEDLDFFYPVDKDRMPETGSSIPAYDVTEDPSFDELTMSVFVSVEK